MLFGWTGTFTHNRCFECRVSKPALPAKEGRHVNTLPKIYNNIENYLTYFTIGSSFKGCFLPATLTFTCRATTNLAWIHLKPLPQSYLALLLYLKSLPLSKFLELLAHTPYNARYINLLHLSKINQINKLFQTLSNYETYNSLAKFTLPLLTKC